MKCKDISTFNQIRLCGLVLKSDYYRKSVEFVPDEKNVEPGCVRRSVKMIHTWSKNISNVWMIPCTAEYIPQKVPIRRYIVPGPHTDEYFICADTEKEGVTFIEGILSHESNQGLEELPIFL